MAPLTPYLSVVQRLEKQAAIPLKTYHDENHLWIRGVEFKPTPVTAIYSPELRGKGVLVRNLSREEAAYCQSNEISFLTSKGELFLVVAGHRILLEPRSQKRRIKRPKTRGAHIPSALPPPTTLISPNGLAILDALFRIDEAALSQFRSASRFVGEYHLNQSKISQMMTHLGSKTLIDLKTKIKTLPDEWWKSALRYPMTRKGLTPFFRSAKPYHLLRNDLSESEAEGALQKWQQLNSTFRLLPGPIEIARTMGLIRDPDIYKWGTQSTLQELKRHFQLIPGKAAEAVTWHLAIPVIGIERESILSPLDQSNKTILYSHLNSNIFRAIWDLSFGGERLREIQIMALRRILDEV